MKARSTTPSELRRYHRFQIDLHRRRLKQAKLAVSRSEDAIKHHSAAMGRLTHPDEEHDDE